MSRPSSKPRKALGRPGHPKESGASLFVLSACPKSDRNGVLPHEIYLQIKTWVIERLMLAPDAPVMMREEYDTDTQVVWTHILVFPNRSEEPELYSIPKPCSLLNDQDIHQAIVIKNPSDMTGHAVKQP